MIQLKYIAPVVALSLAAALAGTGCMAQAPEDPATDEAATATSDPQDEHQATPASCPKDEQEKTGDAKQACWSGPAFPWFGLGGLGWPWLGCGGAALFPFIADGGCGGGIGGGCGGC